MLKIYIKQQVVFNDSGQTVIYTGVNPQSLVAQFNTPLPPSRQWPNYGTYIDATGDVSDLSKLQLTWTEAGDKAAANSDSKYTVKKSATGTLSFEGETFALMKQWLIDDVSASLNAIQVNIHDTACDVWYNDYSINATDIRYCEDVECIFEATLRQKEEPVNCIQRTIINDNWQNWFNGVQDKKHPRFSYCNEQRPNGMMIMLWWFIGLIGTIVIPIVIVIAVVVNIIIAIINVIISIIQFLGGVPDPFKKDIDYVGLSDILNTFAQYYVESAGCGREHPAPLIRDYISNVCSKCGVEVNAETAPIFFAEYITLTTASRGLITSQNHHYNACLFTPVISRGIRRFNSLSLTGATMNLSEWYVKDNTPVWSLANMLDHLKPLYNMEWRIRGNKLYIQRKDFFVDEPYLYDFSAGAPDREKLLEGVCLEWNEVDYPAYCTGLYTQDDADKPGNEIKGYYNDLINFGLTANNPNFYGELRKYAEFAPANFRLAGACEDYIYDALQVVVNGQLLVSIMFDFVGAAFQKYADYGVLLDGETCSLPKVIIWDGASYENAKAVRPYAAHDNAASIGLTVPPINSQYNGDGHRWQDRHPPKTFVRGNKLTIPPQQPGFYLVTDTLGAFEIKQPAMLCNYFMYFAQDFTDTMWDWFHWIDDPNANPRLNMEWSVKIDACCDDFERLKVGQSGQNIKLNAKVKLPTNFITDGVIREITINYDVENQYGAYIELKGIV